MIEIHEQQVVDGCIKRNAAALEKLNKLIPDILLIRRNLILELMKKQNDKLRHGKILESRIAVRILGRRAAVRRNQD